MYFAKFIFASADVIYITSIVFSIQYKNEERLRSSFFHFPVGIYLLKVNNRNTRKTCEICSKLFTPCSSVSIVNFEHVIAGWVNSFHL